MDHGERCFWIFLEGRVNDSYNLSPLPPNFTILILTDPLVGWMKLVVLNPLFVE